nr:hypothetical protein GCM10020092_105490 [Actinoplanes digitatis]
MAVADGITRRIMPRGSRAPKPVCPPVGERDDRAGQADRDKRQPDHDAALEGQPAHPAAGFVVADQPLEAAVQLGEAAEEHQLRADQDREAGVDQRVHVELDPGDVPGAGGEPGGADQAEQEHHQAGPDQGPARREDQQEPQVAPAVAPGAQVRCPAAAVRLERRRHLGHVVAVQRGPDDQLGRELHAGHAQVEVADAVAVEAADAAVEVADALEPEEHPAQPGEHRVAQVAVQERHRALADAAAEPVAHDNVVPVAQALDERPELREVVGVVGVGHDHVAAAGLGDAGDQRGAVALAGRVHHPGAGADGYLLGAVGRSVVADQHLTPDTQFGERTQRLADTGFQGLRLVEAGQQDGDLDVT